MTKRTEGWHRPPGSRKFHWFIDGAGPEVTEPREVRPHGHEAIIDQALAHLNTPGTLPDTQRWVIACAIGSAVQDVMRDLAASREKLDAARRLCERSEDELAGWYALHPPGPSEAALLADLRKFLEEA